MSHSAELTPLLKKLKLENSWQLKEVLDSLDLLEGIQGPELEE